MNSRQITLNVNSRAHQLELDPSTPLLHVLRNDLQFKSPKYGCGSELCGACAVLVDGVAVPTCQLPVERVAGLEITTLEGLADGDEPHPLQEAFIEEQAAQCGFCSAGMIMAAQGLLKRVRYPTDGDIQAALANNLCRCGVYDRVRRAIKLRTGRLEAPICQVIDAPIADAEPEPSSPSLHDYPRIDDWLALNADGSLTVFSGKVELGQGIATALAQIAADELDIRLERIRVVMADTERTPNEGGTTGSRSLETSGQALRIASASARDHLLSLAYEQLDSLTPAQDLLVEDGAISDPISGRSVDYWTLQAGKRFNKLAQPRATKRASAYQLVGQSAKRLDLIGKFSGGESYVQDMAPPGMLHARVLRPPGYHARLLDFDREAIARLPGVLHIAQDGQFIALVAEREEQAMAAVEMARAHTTWQFTRQLPPSHAIYRDLRGKPAQSNLIVDGVAIDAPIPPRSAVDAAHQTLRASYRRPFQMHASLGPSAALALWQDGRLTVWSHTQAAFTLRGALAQVLGLEEASIRVIHREGAGCYGHNGADDVALDAALAARDLPGQPVMLKWSRWDEHAWEPYGSAMLLELQASLSDEGRIIDWNHDVWSYGHSTRPSSAGETSGLLAARHLARPFAEQPASPMPGYHSGAHRNADPIYAFSSKRVVRHAAADSPLRVSALRSLGAYANIFAIESFMDELAAACNADPLEFRLRHLDDERARDTLAAAADAAGWAGKDASKTSDEGWGMALAQYKNLQAYCAIIVKLHVDRQSGGIGLREVVIAADAGQAVNPDGLSNQLEGGFVQAASWTLFEAVSFDQHAIKSVDWQSYPILPVSAAPRIQTVILNRPGSPWLGAGEAAQNPAPAAIANAVCDAVGIRLRDLPFRPDKVLAALA